MHISIDIPDVQLPHIYALLVALLVYILAQQIRLTAPIQKYRHNDDTWALVTGASDGIGYELVVQLATSGFNVILHGRNQAKLDKLIKGLETRFPERKFRPWILDASDRQSHHLIDTFKTDLERDGTHLSVLINNVGISVFEGANFLPFAEVPSQHIAKLVDVNAVFPTRLTNALLPLLTRTPSALVLNLGSAAGLFPAIYTSIYGACKAYQFHLTKILRNELLAENQQHVVVKSVLIGLVQSAGTKEFIAKPSLFAPSSATYAKAIIDSVASGTDMINPYLPHRLQMSIPLSVPAGVLAFLVRRAGLDMKATEQKQLQDKETAAPSTLAQTLVS